MLCLRFLDIVFTLDKLNVLVYLKTNRARDEVQAGFDAC